MKTEWLVKSQLEKVPLVDALVRPPLRLCKRSWQATRLAGLRLAQHLKYRGCEHFDADDIMWVSPKDIKFCALTEFGYDGCRGMIVDGDWDRMEKRFDSLDVYHAIGEVCVEGRPWKTTVFYRRIVEDLDNGGIRWGCRTRSDFDERCAGLERLFRDIQKRGYRSQDELAHERCSAEPFAGCEEITVSIGRHGDLLFSNGAHRLTMAKLLRIDRIPVLIAVRHPLWVRRAQRGRESTRAQ